MNSNFIVQNKYFGVQINVEIQDDRSMKSTGPWWHINFLPSVSPPDHHALESTSILTAIESMCEYLHLDMALLTVVLVVCPGVR
jgi:hypothetical protein